MEPAARLWAVAAARPECAAAASGETSLHEKLARSQELGERCARRGGARTRCAGCREIGRGRKVGADVKDTLQAYRVWGRGRESWPESKGHI